jgi:hypothetical protein
MDRIELYVNRYGGYSAVEILLDTTRIAAQGSPYAPVLVIPFEYHCRYIVQGAQKEHIEYTLIELGGYLGLQKQPKLAALPANPLMQKPNEGSYRSTGCFFISLDSKRIELMERHRQGDMEFQLELWGTALMNQAGCAFMEKFDAHGPLNLKVPQSTWTSNVLNAWKFGQTHLIEIEAVPDETKVISPKAMECLRDAERHFLQHNAKETMVSLYLAFEVIAKQCGNKSPDKNFFADLLSMLPSDLRDKYKDLFHSYCTTLHVGRHDSGQEDAERVPVDCRDAQLALILGQAILSYISKLS